jgi:glycosyltransferase involved in cell wall biosynthesis
VHPALGEEQQFDRRHETEMPTALIYRRKLLPFSETFIKRQVQSLTHWNGILVGESMPDGMPLDGLAHHFIEMPDPSTGVPKSSLAARIFRFFVRPKSRKLTPYARAKATAKAIRAQKWFPHLQRLSPQILHVHFGTNAEEAWPLALALNIPIVVTLHGYDAGTYASYWESGAGGRRYRRYPEVLRTMAHHGARFIAVSDAIAESALEYGLPPESIRKILIGVDTTAINPGTTPICARPRRILFAGRFVEKKGAEYLIRAFNNVKAAVPDAELTLIGEGKLEPELKSLAESNAIRFAGRMPAEQVLDEMQRAKVLCVPSVRAANGDSEGLPTVIFEAQASGLPVVTSARGGTTEGIIDGKTGIAFAERDHEALAAALIRCLTDDAFAAAASKAARRFAETSLEMSDKTGELESYYDEVVRTFSPTPN